MSRLLIYQNYNKKETGKKATLLRYIILFWKWARDDNHIVDLSHILSKISNIDTDEI